MASCSTSKTSVPATYTPTEPTREVVKSLEGEKVIKKTVKDNGIAMSESLSEDGMSIISVAYRWFSVSTSTINNKAQTTEIINKESEPEQK